MKSILILCSFLLMTIVSKGQSLFSGSYNDGLRLAIDNNTHILTGYFEAYSGWDERTKGTQFSCVFYLEGVIKDNHVKIQTYYPDDKPEDYIKGTLDFINNQQVNIKLDEEHGGCWNVQHFADDAVEFDLDTKANWLQIRYVKAKKAFFYSGKSNTTKQKSYLVENDFVCIDKIAGDWIHCSYYGAKTTTGWMKNTDLNKL